MGFPNFYFISYLSSISFFPLYLYLHIGIYTVLIYRIIHTYTYMHIFTYTYVDYVYSTDKEIINCIYFKRCYL